MTVSIESGTPLIKSRKIIWSNRKTCLGIEIDLNLIDEKAQRSAAALSSLMSNIGGPQEEEACYLALFIRKYCFEHLFGLKPCTRSYNQNEVSPEKRRIESTDSNEKGHERTEGKLQ